jgi:pyridinium-3,5-bisthiocarboxylic acid mononucleotide nickel chelatase
MLICSVNPFAGISGDMFLGALLDLGAPIDAVRAAIESTGVTGWELSTRTVQRAGVRSLHAVVTVADAVPERRAGDLLAAVRRARPAPVAAVAARAITLLAEVEAGIHGVAVADVHLHELGGVDTIVDIVGVAAAMNALKVDELFSGPIGVGTGRVGTAHGVLPAPAPATLALLAGAPISGVPLAAETVTPTGAVLLRALGARYDPLPPSTLERTGYGAGTRDPAGMANVLPASLLRPAETVASRLICVETNVDDVTGELLADVIADLLAAGALDAWLTPIVGKKGRPAYVVTALCEPAAADLIEDTVLRGSGSLGVRRYAVDRRALPRRTVEVAVDGMPIRVKVGPYHAKAEHDDVAAAAAASGRSRREIADEAVRSVRQPGD